LLGAAAEAEKQSASRSSARKPRRSGTSPKKARRSGRRSGTSPRKPSPASKAGTPSPAGKAGKSSPAGKAGKSSRARRLSNRISDLAGSAKQAASTPKGKMAMKAGLGLAGLAGLAAGGVAIKRRMSGKSQAATGLVEKIAAAGGYVPWSSLSADEKILVGDHPDNAGKMVRVVEDGTNGTFEVCDQPSWWARTFGSGKPSNCAKSREAPAPVDYPTTAPAPRAMGPAGRAAARRAAQVAAAPAAAAAPEGAILVDGVPVDDVPIDASDA